MLNHFASRAKAYAALIGAVATALLGTYDNKTLALVAAVCTAIATYAVPNAPASDPGEGGTWAPDLSLIVGFIGGLFLGFLLWHR